MSEPVTPILVVEDDPQIRRFLRAALPAHGFRLLEAETGADGLTQAATRAPEVVLLDLGLPDLDGLDFIRRLREWSAMPVIVLSARGLERDKVAALDAGADDGGAVFTVGDLSVDLAGHLVRVGGREVRLTPTEFRILAVLARHAGKVVTHRQLLVEVWGPGSAGNTHYLRVQMHGLRH
ncbi:MAG TPA: response regulator, partial [Candidatus Polarisedimenticolia bacterium]|nr:response regulator [Candidatus Polarisedimenticolia bacterium]